MIHSVKGFGTVNKADVDVFLELSCFFNDPTDVGNLISGSSTFSKPSLNIWKFSVHVLLKPSLKDFEHYFASMWNECNLDNHVGVVTHLEPDILECEVKWALESITTNKASGGDGIPAELFEILKDHAFKVLTPYARKFGKLSSGHRTGKGQFSFQSQRKAMPKNVQTTTQLDSFHMLAK